SRGNRLDARPAFLHVVAARQKAAREVCIAPHAADDGVERNLLQSAIHPVAHPQLRLQRLEAHQPGRAAPERRQQLLHSRAPPCPPEILERPQVTHVYHRALSSRFTRRNRQGVLIMKRHCSRVPLERHWPGQSGRSLQYTGRVPGKKKGSRVIFPRAAASATGACHKSRFSVYTKMSSL